MLSVLAAVVGLAVVLGGAFGSAPIPLGRVATVLLDASGWFDLERLGADPAERAILLELRLPRVLGALVVGVGLSVAGALMQGVFRNPLADPYVLGASAGAGLGAAVAIGLGLQLSAAGFGPVPLSAFVGALASLLLVWGLARVGWRTPTTHLLLAGVAVSSMLAALTSALMLASQGLQARLGGLLAWLLGGAALSGWAELGTLAPLLALGLVLALALARALDALALGEEGAEHVGIRVERLKLAALAVAALLTAVAVSSSGLVGFVGLIVPHVVRLLVGPAHRLLLPASALAGGAFVVIVDLGARTLLAPAELPVGLLTSLLGAPFFLWLLRRGARAGTPLP